MKRKVLSLLLCFAMLFSLMPTMAFAAEDEEDTEHLVTIELVDTSGTGVAGAALTLSGTTINGAELEPYSWISTGGNKKFQLIPGTYTLTETKAPTGYIKAENIIFKVNLNGTIMMNDATVKNVVMVHEIAPCTHVEAIDEAVVPTCTETGLTEGKHCSVCSKVLVAQETVAALGHTEATDEAVAPTCTETGLTEGKHCSVCGEVMVAQETVAALGHTEVTDEAVAPTCTTAGLTEGKHCSVCGEVLVAQTEIAALGHSYPADSKCDEAVECTRCHEIKAAGEHLWDAGTVTTPATCTVVGVKTFTCSACDETKTEGIAALGHTEVTDAAVAATCTTAGKTEGKHCSVCNEVLVAQTEVAALGHTEVIDEAVAATCTEKGKAEGKHCSVCNEVLVAQTEITALGHSFTGNKCDVCGYTKSSGGSSSGGSSSGSSAPAAYAITVTDSTHGSISTSAKTASSGDTVKITVSPDKGYTLETIAVTDKNGKEVDLTATEIGKTYTFKMPVGAITVKATFMEDNTMLNYFVDVTASDYYYDAVLWAAENGITGGVDAVHFAPNSTCTRAQAVTFLWRAAGRPEVAVTDTFGDVVKGSYYEKAVAWAVANGITSGTSATTFSPDADCTRAQIVCFLHRANKVDTPNVKNNSFNDVNEGAYYYNAVLWAAENGITGGTSATTFSPDANCTRAQIVTFLYRFMNK